MISFFRSPKTPVDTPATTLYIRAVVGLCVLAVVAIITLFVVRPDKDHTALITLILGVLMPAISALLAAAVQQVHLAVNSRLTQLLALTQKASLAEGVLTGGAEARAESVTALATAVAAQDVKKG
jgi:hypothetical protein